MTARYVIVCRDGHASHPFSKFISDQLLASWLQTHHGETRPAYRIRIREKARKHWSDGLNTKQVQWVNEVCAIQWD
jgi:hypothetical protein